LVTLALDKNNMNQVLLLLMEVFIESMMSNLFTELVLTVAKQMPTNSVCTSAWCKRNNQVDGAIWVISP